MVNNRSTPVQADATGKPKPRMALLDALRLVAALAVVLFHYTAWHHSFWSGNGPQVLAADAWPGLSTVTAYGNLGVQLFFIISGLVVFRSLEGRSVGRFLGSRVGRIFPAFWVAVLFSGLLQKLIWSTPQPSLTWSDVALNLTLAGPPIQGRPWVDGVFWTLWIEARFYVTLLVLRWVLKRLKRDDATGWSAVVMLWTLVGTAIIAFAGVPPVDSMADRWLMPTYVGLFAAGMMIHLMAKNGVTPFRLLVTLLATGQAAWATALDLPKETANVTPFSIPGWHYALAVILMVALVAALVFTPLKGVGWRWATVAGSLTYPVYLLHEVPGWFVIAHLTPVLPRWVVLILTLALVLGASWAVHRWVETPFGPKLSRWVDAWCTAVAGWVRGAWMWCAGRWRGGRPE